jgi:hypothetical protein
MFGHLDWRWSEVIITEMIIDTYFSCVTYCFLQVVDVILDGPALIVSTESFIDAVMEYTVPAVTVHEGHDSYGDLCYQDNQQEHCKLKAHSPHFIAIMASQYNLFLFRGVGQEKSIFGTSATDDRCGGFGRMKIGKGNLSTRDKSGAHDSVVVNALCYKPEGSRFVIR